MWVGKNIQSETKAEERFRARNDRPVGFCELFCQFGYSRVFSRPDSYISEESP